MSEAFGPNSTFLEDKVKLTSELGVDWVKVLLGLHVHMCAYGVGWFLSPGREPRVPRPKGRKEQPAARELRGLRVK